jgi:hypothetical protein
VTGGRQLYNVKTTEGATMAGPYETETEALAEPLYQEIHALHMSGQVRSGDPDRLVSSAQLRHREDACEAAGVELGAFDRRTLTWLAGYEPSTVQVIIGLITRAAEGSGTHH